MTGHSCVEDLETAPGYPAAMDGHCLSRGPARMTTSGEQHRIQGISGASKIRIGARLVKAPRLARPWLKTFSANAFLANAATYTWVGSGHDRDPFCERSSSQPVPAFRTRGR